MPVVWLCVILSLHWPVSTTQPFPQWLICRIAFAAWIRFVTDFLRRTGNDVGVA